MTDYKTNAPWVVLTHVPPGKTGQTWRVTEVTRLTAAENAGRQNVFIYLEIAGQVIYSGVSVRYGWAGQTDDQKVEPKALDKRPPDPSTDLVIGKRMHLWFEVVDPAGHPSDRVANLHNETPDGTLGGEWGHGSYNVTLERLPDVAVVDPPTVPPVGSNADVIALLEQAIQILRG